MVKSQLDLQTQKSQRLIEKDIFIQYTKYFKTSIKMREGKDELEKKLSQFRLDTKSKMLSQWLLLQGIEIDSKLLKLGISQISQQFDKSVREAKVGYIEQERKNS